MKNSKILIYSGLLAFGLLLGWLVFGNSSGKNGEHQHEIAETSEMWTCSMHPQIMVPEPGNCPICGMELIPAENGADGLTVDQFKLSKNAMALANIQTTLVGQGTAESGKVILSGKIVENEEENSIQVSYFSGRIERLNINFTGEEVRRGQLLATIYSPELFAAQQELITAASLKESQPALYAAVRNKLKLWKLSEGQIDKIESSGKVQENFPVYATVSGTVSEKLVAEGDYVEQGQPLLKVANLNSVWANFDVYEDQIPLFKVGQDITIATKAYANETFKAKVSFINPVLNSKTRTVKLRAELANVNNMFKPGMFVEGSIPGISGKAEHVLNVPASAVLWTGERSVVYIKMSPDEPVFEMREILLGRKSGETYEVLSGLNNGDEIVTNGTFTVDAAAQLQGKKSMMNKAGGKTTTGHEGHLGVQTNDSEGSVDRSGNSETKKRVTVSNKFQKQLKLVFDAYILLKDALVYDKPEEARNAALGLTANLANVDMKLLSNEEAHSHWMKIQKELKTAANAIGNTSEIRVQRGHFKHLSAQMIRGIQLFGINQKVYIEFCPMADNNKGAYWLSLEEEIRNPYFGEEMLTCGEIKQVIE